MEKRYVLAINPGSTSTKVSLFEGEKEVKSKKLEHDKKDLENFDRIIDQFSYRLKAIEDWLNEENISLESLRAVVGRGGLLRPMPSGTYLVTDAMILDLQIGIQGEHASNLGGILAKHLADKLGINAYIVDPVAVDEFEDVARISGLKEIPRRSLVHALNIKAVCHRYADEKGKKIDELNLVIAHLGGGISISPIKNGRIVDANNANQMGPFSPERSGTLPVGDLVELCFSGKYNERELKKMTHGKGGLVSYLGTFDGREVLKRIEDGDIYAKLIYDAMCYQIGKEIASMATVLKGNVEAIIITGGLAYSNYLIEKVKEMVSFIAPIYIYPGEDEMRALNEGVLRVLNNEENAKIYEEEVEKW
ncbi:butyrate kinase [Soehngenia saccharolytica]|nr:butyrate kinase [Soehngenia saccharolytica]